jgi:hypothetical protein
VSWAGASRWREVEPGAGRSEAGAVRGAKQTGPAWGAARAGSLRRPRCGNRARGTGAGAGGWGSRLSRSLGGGACAQARYRNRAGAGGGLARRGQRRAGAGGLLLARGLRVGAWWRWVELVAWCEELLVGEQSEARWRAGACELGLETGRK